MSPSTQNIIALTIVACCVAYVAWQAIRTLSGKRSKVGNCCAKGCGDTQPASTKPQIAYIPADSLIRRRK